MTQPHLAAATASTAGALFAYVVNLNVPKRERNDAVEEGLYSEAELEDEREAAGEVVEFVMVGSLNGNAFFVREAVRERIAARCGAVFDKLSNSFGADLCGKVMRTSFTSHGGRA